MSSLIKSPHKHLFISSLFVFIITAFFSEGYYHPDEHFQILEFANYKLGNSPASDLPWEFKEQIRPALQPALAYSTIKFLNFTGITSPFSHALLLRVLTALLSWFVICKSVLFLSKDFVSEKGKKIFIFLSLFPLVYTFPFGAVFFRKPVRD
jgi:phosphatidylinositol glycan class B